MNIDQLRTIREALDAAKQKVSDCEYHTSYEQKVESLKPIESALEQVRTEIKKSK